MKRIIPPYWGKLQGQPTENHVPSKLPINRVSNDGTGRDAPLTGWNGNGKARFKRAGEKGYEKGVKERMARR